MLELELGRFATAHNAICSLGQLLVSNRGKQSILGFDKRGMDDFIDAVHVIRDISETTDLRVTAAIANEIIHELTLIDTNQDMIPIDTERKHLRFCTAVVRLQETVKVDAASAWFLSLGARGARLWRADDPIFGDEVEIAFPSAQCDIEEAAKCLAVERSTACVMHLMRATEVPLKALASSLGIGLKNDWGSYIRDIDKELASRLKASGRRSAEEAFYAEASEAFERVKRLWRNRTMHVDAVYTAERANDIFEATRHFMAHLATRIRE
jgi:hypothetical protein